VNKKRLSAIGSLRELVVILSGITITFSLGRIVDGIDSRAGTNLQAMTLFVLLTLSIVRFYHGNMRLLDDSYFAAEGEVVAAEGKVKARRNIVVDFGVILVTSVVFAAMGAFIQDYEFFFGGLTIILVMDTIWGVMAISANNIEALDIQKRWVINNAVCAFALLVIYIANAQFHLPEQWTFGLMVGCALVSTIGDYVASWEFYFPGVGA
jgi:hypothetical protein